MKRLLFMCTTGAETSHLKNLAKSEEFQFTCNSELIGGVTRNVTIIVPDGKESLVSSFKKQIKHPTIQLALEE